MPAPQSLRTRKPPWPAAPPRPVPLAATADGMPCGESKVLSLHLCIDAGRLRLFDPASGKFLPTNRDKDDLLASKDHTIAAKDHAIAAQRRTIAEHGRTIAEKRRLSEEKDRALEAAEAEIEELKRRLGEP